MKLKAQVIRRRDTGRLSSENSKQVLAVIDYLQKKQHLPLDEKNGELLILHLCDALERIEHRETLPALGQSVYEEVTREPNLERAVSICRDIQEMIPELQASEAEYIIMHVGAMLGNMKS